MTVIEVRNLALKEILAGQSLASDFKTDFIDFKEMNTGFIQVSQLVVPDTTDGVFSLEVSIICEESTFIPYPNSSRGFSTCTNFGWSFCNIAFRYARVCYMANGVTTGSIDIHALARLT